MARTDAIVLGAGIVGTSVALHLAKRGMSVALIDRAGVGEQTSYGNAGIIEGNTVFPPAFPSDSRRAGAHRAQARERGQLSSLVSAAGGALAAGVPRGVARRIGWSKCAADPPAVCARGGRARDADGGGRRDALSAQDRLAESLSQRARFRRAQAGIRSRRRNSACRCKPLDTAGAQALEPSLKPVFAHAVFWPQAASVSNPLASRAPMPRALPRSAGSRLKGDARSLHRAGNRWRVETNEGGVDAPEVVVALGPWAPDLLDAAWIEIAADGQARLSPALPARRQCHVAAAGARRRRGLCDHADGAGHPHDHRRRIRGARCGADRRCSSTASMPKARELFPLGERADDKTWLGSRPCFPDSRPVIGRAPGLAGLWLAIGHAHWGLTLGPATGRMIAEMMAGEAPFCDPAPYRAEAVSR